MDNSGVLLIAALVVCVISWIVQKVLLKKIYQKTGKNLAIGRIVSVLLFFCAMFAIAGPIIAISNGAKMAGWEYLVILAAVVAVAILLVRNIKGAGTGMGIALTVTQVLGGLLVTILGTVAIAMGAAGAQLTGSPQVNQQFDQQKAADDDAAAKRRAELIEEQEAYAQKNYGMSAQDAFNAGLTRGIDPDLLNKD